MHLVLDVGFWVAFGFGSICCVDGRECFGQKDDFLSVVMSIWVRTRKLFQVFVRLAVGRGLAIALIVIGDRD